jgi:hypothetical protein
MTMTTKDLMIARTAMQLLAYDRNVRLATAQCEGRPTKRLAADAYDAREALAHIEAELSARFTEV